MFGKAKRSVCLSGHNHLSISEANYCNTLLAMKQSGEILDFKWQDRVELFINSKRFADWAVDFKVTELDGSHTWHECKGYNLSDESFRLKKDAFLLCYPKRRLFVNWVPAKLYETPRMARKRLKDRLSRLEDYRALARTSKRAYMRNGAKIKKEGIGIIIDYTKE